MKKNKEIKELRNNSQGKVILMGFTGKTFEFAGKTLSYVAEYGIKATGFAIGGTAHFLGNDNLAKKSVKISRTVGEFIGKSTRICARITGTLADTAMVKGAILAQGLGNKAVKTETRIYGDSEEFYDAEKIIQANYKIIDRKK